MGLMDFVKSFAENAAKNGLRTCDRYERNHVRSMSQEQRDKLQRAKSGLGALAEWSSRRDSAR